MISAMIAWNAVKDGEPIEKILNVSVLCLFFEVSAIMVFLKLYGF